MTGSIFDGCRVREREDEVERARLVRARRMALAAGLLEFERDQNGEYNRQCPGCGAKFTIAPGRVPKMANEKSKSDRGIPAGIARGDADCDHYPWFLGTIIKVWHAESDDDVRSIVAAAVDAKKGGRNAP